MTYYIVFTHFSLRKILFVARGITISILITAFLPLLFMSSFFFFSYMGDLIEVVITVFLEY